MKHLNVNQLKLEVHDTYEKDEKIATNFEPSNPDDVINKTHLDKEIFKIDGNIALIENDYDEVKLHYNKQSVEEISIQKAVKTTI